jgi:hypothetical protein
MPGKTYTQQFSTFAAGTYPYFCIPHCVMFNQKATLIITNAASTPPTVTISSPTNGARYLASAVIAFSAATSDMGGNITNVQYLAGSNPLGGATIAPYNFTANGMAAGNYQLSAIARDDMGASATSAVVSVSVLSNAVLVAPSTYLSGPFQLSVRGIAGQSYTLEASTNLEDWTAINTNVAPSNSFVLTDPNATNFVRRYYRARQDL